MNNIDKSLITGIILSGGKSSRMGKEKGLIDFNGQPLISYAIKTMEQIAGKILISANHPDYNKFGHQVIADEIPEFGPLGGLLSCLNQSKTHINLTLSVDSPYVTTDLYEFLLKHVSGYDIVLPEIEPGHYEPLCAFYSLNMRDIYREFAKKGNTKIPDAFKIVQFKAVSVCNEPFYTEKYFANFNTKEDILKYRI